MNELIYDHDNIALWFDLCLWEFKKQIMGQKSLVISFKELIEEINNIPDWSEAEKRHAIIHFGKRARILKEIA